MAEINERTLRMKKGFMGLHLAGKTIPEIAKIYQITETTVRNHLQEIADENNVTRESLLQIVHGPHIPGTKDYKPIQRIDLSSFEKSINVLQSDIETFESEIEENKISIYQKIEKVQGVYNSARINFRLC